MKKEYFVSVIIPVFNDSKGLIKCLRSLEDQTYPKDKYEIIVVDNNSSENISQVTEKFDRVLLFHEKQPGSYISRNRGMKNSKGEIFAFIDSDCIADKNWIKAGVDTLISQENCGLVGGNVKLIFKDAKDLNMVETYEKYIAFRQKDYVQLNNFSGAGNLFTFRSVMECVGQFNEILFSAGDMEWGNRVYAAGYELVYGDNVIAHHPSRYSFKQMYRKTVRVTGGYYTVAVKNKKNGLKNEILAKLKLPVFLLNDHFYGKQVPFSDKYKVFVVSLFNKYISIFENIRLFFKEKTKNY